MKQLILTVLFGIIITGLYGQQKVALDDNTGFISEENKVDLVEKLDENGYDLVEVVDFSNRCDYIYIILEKTENAATIRIQDCEGTILHLRKIGLDLEKMNAGDRLTYLSFAIIESLNTPSLENPEIVEEQEQEKEKTKPYGLHVNEHNTRYFFSPSSFNLKKGELYYQTIYFLLHDVQYGITDQFSIGIGTSIAAFPFYATPKYSFKLAEKHQVSVGDLFMVGTYSIDFVGNLVFATYTYGDEMTNITLGGGYFYSSENDVFNNEIRKPIINVSAMAKLSPYIYFILENYYLPLNTQFEANYYNGLPNPPQMQTEDFTMRDHHLAGFIGFRLVSKTIDVRAWQIGIVYYNRFLEDEPSKYRNNELWNTTYPEFRRIFLPQVSFTYKFGKKY